MEYEEWHDACRFCPLCGQDCGEDDADYSDHLMRAHPSEPDITDSDF